MNSEGIKRITLNPWVTMIETRLTSENTPYIHLEVPNYVFVLAISNDGMIPLVSQFRIPLMRNTLELPAGLMESDQSPKETALRELREETGVSNFSKVIELPPMTLDSGRIKNETYGTIVLGAERPPESDFFQAELDTSWVTSEELISLAMSGKIDHMGQIALILWASKAGYL